MEKLGIQPFNLIAQIINFFILLFLLTKILYKPILKVLDERKRKIKEVLEKEREIEAEISKIEEKRLREIEKAEREAREIIRQAENFAKNEEKKTRQEMKEMLKEAKKKAQKEFEREREALMSKLKDQVLELVLLTTRQVLRSSINKEHQRDLTKEALEKLKDFKEVPK